jgi:Skp family chaperone for outer membrane proteins
MKVKTMFVVAAAGVVLAANGWAQTKPAPQKPAPTAPATPAPTPAPQTPPPAAQPPKPFPADAKFAYADVQVIASNSAEGKAATARLDDLRKKKTAELAEKNKQAQALQTKLEQGGTVLSDQVRSQTEKELEKLQREIQFSQQDAQTEVNEMTQQLQAEFQQKLAPVVEQIATEKGLQIVFSARDVGALYFNPALDLTDEIIKRFDAASKTGTKK